MNPRESLIHVTSHGETAAQKSGTLNFQNYTKTPIKDVNRIGLVHYSIPKTLDHLDHTNNTFIIRFTFAAESGVNGDGAPADIGNTVNVKVTVPLLDYYNCKVATVVDQADDHFQHLEVSDYGTTFCKSIHTFEEILQTAINQAIIKAFDQKVQGHYTNPASTNPAGYETAPARYQALSRLNCIVMYNFGRGVYELFFGYRGTWNIDYHDGLDEDGKSQVPSYGGTFQSYTGAPADLLENGDSHPAVTSLLSAGGEAYFISPSGRNFNPHRIFNHVPVSIPANPQGKPGADVLQQIVVSSIYIYGLSPRLQLMLGCNESTTHASTVTNRPYLRRGWVGLVNYRTTGPTLPIHKITLDNPPNLKPPAFLILQLTTQGTRSRMLGHENERGGWAIPTEPNQFVSKHHNHISGHIHPLLPVRGVKMNPVRATVKYHNNPIKANWDSGMCWPNPDIPSTGHGYHFDAIPRNGYGTAANGGTTGNGNSYGMNTIFNFSDTGSEHIQFKNLDLSKKDQDCCIVPQSYQFLNRKSPVFTVSLIQPNWLYTQMDNATVQSMNIKLLWGDTGTPVNARCGNPTQASFIIAP